ncbi:MAG: hypothetical protein ACOYON_05680 [Fimbriimonas sp.]
MSILQKFFLKILPKAIGEDMRRDSMRWIVKCQCGFGRSIWEMGGIRWKASGSPKTLLKCPECGERSWHSVVYEQDSNVKV